ncbi:Anoctamin-5 (Gnathodiaphyseal dysplasia 1 protein) (Transmembrane protein 16E) [Durusdinium trenchii]
MTFGMQNTDAAKYFKYLVTANIKVVDAVWTPLCIYLTKHENHRTEMALKSALILKLFAVKSVLFYYPFIRTIFIQPHVEGCPGPGNHISGCLDSLRADLQLFFITQVISVGAGLMVQLAMMYWTVRKELQRKKSDDGKLSYVEVQAMLADYDEEAEVSDYLQVVLNFGFLSMFGCVAPSMCVLCFLSNLPMKRLLAFRFSFSQKRVVPIITHGLGSWELILNFIAYIGVTLTCYIVIFAYNSLDLEDFRTQLLLFIAIERAVAVLKLMLTLVFGEKSLAQERIEEQNEEVLELIVASEIKKHHQRTHP